MEPGATCDNIPEFDQDKTLIWIEYPGTVKNVDRMIKSLGGLKNISGTYQEDNKRIDLRFRPEDPCCHPVCGDRTSVNALLLKVKKYKRKKKADEASQPDEFRYVPEIVGVIETAYKFSGLCDFQYLPLYNDVQNDKLVNMIPSLQVLDLDDGSYTKDVPLFLPPATFSRFDQRQDVLFRNDSKYRKQGVLQPDRIGVTRPRRGHFAQYLKFEEDWTPKEALPGALDVLDRMAKSEDVLVEGIRKLFEKRPIWSKNAIACQLQCPHQRLKNVLPALAYYFITGPWRSLWVRLNYDPRKDPEAAKYQLLDFRIRQGLNTPHIPIKAKRSTLQYRLPNLLPRSKVFPTSLVNNLDEQNASTSKTKRSLSESVYIYKPGELPAYRQTFYQVCDILHQSVEEILMENIPPKGNCNSKSGWLPDGVSAKMRDILSKDIQKTISKQYNGIQIRGMERDAHKKLAGKKKTDENLVEDVSLLSDNMRVDSSGEEEAVDDINTIGEPGSVKNSLQEDDSFENYAGSEIDDGSSNLDTEDPLESTELLYGDDVEDLDDFLDDFDAYSPDDVLEEDSGENE